jgi:GMP synthase-like glutamine amidotransferase
MKIGILVTGHIAEALQGAYGEYDAMFARWLSGYGFTFQGWFVVDGQFPAGPEEADGWLITGSKHGAYEGHDWIPPLERLIRDIIASGRPLVGICFGHQIIAQALGGRVEKVARGWSVGRTTYQTEAGPLTLDAWHQDQVVDLPEGARVLAKSDFCPYAALAYDDKVLSYQAHPEFPAAYTRDLIEVRGPGIVPDDLLRAARAETGQPNDSARIAETIVAFFKHARVPA